jgi:chromosome segregation ATPase
VDARQRECQDLLNLLEEHEAEVTVQRQSLAEAVAEFEASRRHAEADIQKRRDQLQARERELQQLADRLRAEAGAAAAVPPTTQALQELEQRKAELDNYARHLRQSRVNGTGTPNKDDELATLRAENERLRRQREEVDALRNDMQSREDELERLRQAEAEWRDMQTALADLETLRQENERLRDEVARRENDLRDRAKLQAGADELRRERDGLRDQLRAATAEQERLRQLAEQEPEPPDMVELVKDGEDQAEAKARAEELTRLREQLDAARADLKRLQDQQSQARPSADHPADADTDALRAENDRLHKQMIELTEGLEEKARLQTRLDEQRRQLVILRDQLREKEAELRRSQAQAAPGTPEQGDLVTAIETLLKENDEYRERLHVHAQQLKEKADLQSRVESLQAEISVLRAQLPGQGDAEQAGDMPTALLRPSKFLLRENEALKTRLAEQEAVVRETDRLKSEIISLRGKLESQAKPPASPLSESSWHELFAAAAGNESLLKETEALRDRLAEQQKQLAELAQLREENAALRAKQPAGSEESAPVTDDDRQRLKTRITELEAHLHDREVRLTALQGQNAKLKEGIDEDNLAAVEAKMARERKVLQEERAALEQTLTRVQRDRKELDATVHTTELQLAKDRVQITREWAELNRKREEFRMEMEKEKRDSIRDNLERVRRIKEETQAKRNVLSPLSNSRSGERKPEPANTPE